MRGCHRARPRRPGSSSARAWFEGVHPPAWHFADPSHLSRNAWNLRRAASRDPVFRRDQLFGLGEQSFSDALAANSLSRSGGHGIPGGEEHVLSGRNRCHRASPVSQGARPAAFHSASRSRNFAAVGMIRWTESSSAAISPCALAPDPLAVGLEVCARRRLKASWRSVSLPQLVVGLARRPIPFHSSRMAVAGRRITFHCVESAPSCSASAASSSSGVAVALASLAGARWVMPSSALDTMAVNRRSMAATSPRTVAVGGSSSRCLALRLNLARISPIRRQPFFEDLDFGGQVVESPGEMRESILDRPCLPRADRTLTLGCLEPHHAVGSMRPNACGSPVRNRCVRRRNAADGLGTFRPRSGRGQAGSRSRAWGSPGRSRWDRSDWSFAHRPVICLCRASLPLSLTSRRPQ